jgi:adenosylhomocysteinase
VVVSPLDDESTKLAAVKWLEERQIRVVSRKKAAEKKYFLDCAAVLTRTATRTGKDSINVVELTKTGEDYLRDVISKGHRIKAISVDNSHLKGWGENVHGTAFGLVDVLSRLNIYPPGHRALIVGFGRVGRGCARILKSLGCRVDILDVSEKKILEALYEGFEVVDEISQADIVITCTGVKGVIGEEELQRVKNGAILINLGAEREIEPHGTVLADYGCVKKYRLGEKRFYIVADGYAANLVVGSGSPIEVMDRTFSAAILALNYLKEDFEGIIPLPGEIERRVVRAMVE